MQDSGGGYEWHNSQVESGQNSGENVLGHHHLRASEARVDLRAGKDMVLSRVRKAIQQQVN